MTEPEAYRRASVLLDILENFHAALKELTQQERQTVLRLLELHLWYAGRSK